MREKDPGLWKVLLATTIGHAIWGFSFMAGRLALNIAPVLVLLSHRFLLAFFLMSLYPKGLRDVKQLPKKQLPWLLLLGLLEPVLYFFGEQYGLLHSTTIFSGVMIAVIPVVATLAAWLILRERPSFWQLFFCTLSVGGVIGVGLLSGSGGRPELIGVLALLLAVVTASGYSLLSRKLAGSLSSYVRTWFMMGVGAVVFTILALIQCRSDLSAYLQPLGNGTYLLSLLFLSVFCSVISYVLYGWSITRLTVARESVFANLTTAVSVFAGAIFLKEPCSWMTVVCCIVILLGIWGVQRTGSK